MKIKIKSPRIILVRPSHPGNIGAVARAMKTMGLNDLVLVSPKKFPDEQAFALATHAEDILRSAKTVKSITQALKNIHYVYATSANSRGLSLPVYTPKSACEKIILDHQLESKYQTALLFGPENHGLNNQDLLYAHGLIQIPTSKNYHSLNLSQAVQVIAYEYHQILLSKEILKNNLLDLADMKELQFFYLKLEKILTKINYLDPEKPRQLMPKLKNLFNRSHLKKNELKILQGILKAIDAKTD